MRAQNNQPAGSPPFNWRLPSIHPARDPLSETARKSARSPVFPTLTFKGLASALFPTLTQGILCKYPVSHT